MINAREEEKALQEIQEVRTYFSDEAKYRVMQLTGGHAEGIRAVLRAVSKDS